jgi:hypothetical protein
MQEPFYIGSYWKARVESVETCAKRAELFFHLLATCDRNFTQWFKKGKTLDEALMHRVLMDMPALLEHFGERSLDGGFSLRAWNGDPDAGSTISLHCGNASVWAANLCIVHPPEEGPAAERVFQVPPLAQILRAMIVSWEPEWGVVTSSELRNIQGEDSKAGTFLGWITYFSHRRGALPALPPTVQVEPVEDRGSLVILTPERFCTANPEHMERVRTVASLLQHAGLLGPLTPWDR